MPDLKEWEVWAEGYAATGERGQAQLMGKYTASTFAGACLRAAVDGGWHGLYDAAKNTYWGCHLFDNEADARKSFG